MCHLTVEGGISSSSKTEITLVILCLLSASCGRYLPHWHVAEQQQRDPSGVHHYCSSSYILLEFKVSNTFNLRLHISFRRMADEWKYIFQKAPTLEGLHNIWMSGGCWCAYQKLCPLDPWGLLRGKAPSPSDHWDCLLELALAPSRPLHRTGRQQTLQPPPLGKNKNINNFDPSFVALPHCL